jgi:hypothetical protein
VVVTLPSSVCALRPIGMTRSDFLGARGELARAADELFPYPEGDVMLGFIELADNDGAGAASRGASVTTDDGGETVGGAGVVVGVQRSRAAALLDRVAEACGRPADAVLSPTMAMLGFGMQHAASAWVYERSPLGMELVHRLRYGLPVSLGEPVDGGVGDDAYGRDVVRRLPSALPGHAEEAYGLAAAAVVARRVAPGSFAPLRGKAGSPARRWLTPAALLAVAVVLTIGALEVSEARFAAGAERMFAKQESIAAEYARVAEARRELERLSALLEEASSRGAGEPSRMLGALDAAHRVVPPDAFVRELDVDRESVRLVGAAQRAQTVLRNLESSPWFTAAQQAGAYLAFTELDDDRFDGYETFDLAAERTDGGGVIRGEAGALSGDAGVMSNSAWGGASGASADGGSR